MTLYLIVIFNCNFISHFDSFSYFKLYLKIAVFIFHSEAGNRRPHIVRAINAVRFYNLILMMCKERPVLNIPDIYNSMSREHT